MKNYYSLLLTFILLGCGTSTPQEKITLEAQNQPIETKEVEKLEPEPEREITDADLEVISSSNNALAFKLFNYLKEDNKNHFISAYSLSNTLAVIFAASQGETQKQILQAIGLQNFDKRILLKSFEELDNRLPRLSNHFELAISNDLWIDTKCKVKPSFLETLSLSTHDKVSITEIDFHDNSELAREEINALISQQTSSHISELLPKGSLQAETKLLLTNAIYLKAKWKKSFFKSDTTPQPFTTLSKEKIEVPMMHQKNSFEYKKIPNAQILFMDYKDSEYRIMSILPNEGEFENIENNLSCAFFQEITTNLEEKYIDLYYPKLTTETKALNLTAPLQEAGMIDAFTLNADFSAITDNKSLHVSNIVQKTLVTIDEEGTEAASATATTIAITNVQKPITVEFNRPFIFALCHKETKTVLFLGRVVNPIE